MRILIAAAIAVTLAACQPTAEPAKTSDVATTPAEGPTPEAFVRSLYDTGYSLEPGEGLWSARVDALVAETRRLTAEGDMGFFEADPICDCQDGTPVLRGVTVTSTGPDKADVAVIQGFADVPGTTHHKTYNLVREGGAWKIDDMHYGDMNSDFEFAPLQAQLNSWIADAKAGAAG